MQFEEKLIKGEIVGSYHDVILDVKIDDDVVVSVFCPQADVMKTLYTRGVEAYILKNPNRNRKVKYELQMINRGEGLIFVNSGRNKQLALEALENNLLPDFADAEEIEQEVDKEESAFAYLAITKKNGQKQFVYIENIYGKAGGYAVFPSYVSFEYLNMLEESARLRAEGHETAVLMIVPRADCADVKFSWAVDQAAAAKVFEAAKSGLKFFGYACNLDKNGVSLGRKLNILY